MRIEGRHDGIADSVHIRTERNGILTFKFAGLFRPVIRTPRIVVTVYNANTLYFIGMLKITIMITI